MGKDVERKGKKGCRTKPWVTPIFRNTEFSEGEKNVGMLTVKQKIYI